MKNNFKKITFQLFSCIFLPLIKLINEKYFSIKEKIGLIFIKIFFFYFRCKTHFRSCKRINKKSCYLLIILNLVFNILIAIYHVLNHFFFNFIN